MIRINFDDLPELAPREAARRTKKHSRRSVLKSTLAVAVGIGVSYITLFDAKKASAAKYFKDVTDINNGPCYSGAVPYIETDPMKRGYAWNHSETNKKCGPSKYCDDGACCDFSNGAPSVNYDANTHNALGWFHYGVVGAASYKQRPDECLNGTYDSWRWKYKDGTTYRCSDGIIAIYGATDDYICPWALP